MIADKLTLPCGAVLPNRLAKSALSEQLGDRAAGPSDRLLRLYERWGGSGCGLLATGNVMVDRSALGEPANVVVEDDRHGAALTEWARAAKAGGATAIVQVNHPGRQSPRSLSPRPVAPSAVPLTGMGGVFSTPRALTVAEIEALVRRYAATSRIVVEAGFDGVQLHAAHGYLISQFLSPRVNRRDDRYGGDPERRRSFLLELVAATREAIGRHRILSVKMNSADFQRGGFSEDESILVARDLADAGVDLLEISGGTYEKAAMMGLTQRDSTRAREAYFLEFAERLRAEVDIPLWVTGGFRSRTGMDQALSSGAVDVIGLGRPLAVDPEFPRRLLAGEVDRVAELTPKRVGVRKLDGMAETVWYTTQLWRMGDGKEPATQRHAALGVAHYLLAGQLPALARGRATRKG
ncbi:NADH:flavin oxidoreductase/NADH oxidase family protein [Nocardioides donggukensis]|uniref:NADH:flavin oxidoreductase/NADH oxidase family protein n=1 Tax=Nocardioides donggukensis TaxID=2774019 RepID=A0A927K449_9ACTN|nr:NADH:flavin oxidoreductase/NADH oxidase family protein [Nocardioides donggukensis]MBD8869358.1 NADH:flavin oxidoreductase/NADH oxidase family protein [Nocardioides donggukensis]